MLNQYASVSEDDSEEAKEDGGGGGGGGLWLAVEVMLAEGGATVRGDEGCDGTGEPCGAGEDVPVP